MPWKYRVVWPFCDLLETAATTAQEFLGSECRLLGLRSALEHAARSLACYCTVHVSLAVRIRVVRCETVTSSPPPARQAQRRDKPRLRTSRLHTEAQSRGTKSDFETVRPPKGGQLLSPGFLSELVAVTEPFFDRPSVLRPIGSRAALSAGVLVLFPSAGACAFSGRRRRARC